MEKVLNQNVVPVFKWVGGKRQLLPSLSAMLPDDYSVYCEPFLGGGAMLFHLQPDVAIVNDVNSELINAYKVIRDDVDGLIDLLRSYKNDESFYYQIRNIDRDAEAYAKLSDVERASRLIYLNHTCFNGVYRVNSKGEFNVPFGFYKNPNIVNESGLRSMSSFFNRSDITFLSGDYTDAISMLPDDAFVYLDPPYDPLSKTANFTGYAKGGFSREDQIRLRGACDAMNARGIRFMQSNAATSFVMELYSDYNLTTIKANRSINRNGNGRGAVDEVVICNYKVEG